MMTVNQKAEIERLQRLGLGYRKIAAELALSVDAVKSYCRRHPVKPELNDCLQCGTPLKQTPHRKRRKFCSERCRTIWWNHNRDKGQGQTRYASICAFCGKHYVSTKANRQYCSRRCYADARRKAVKK
jgi:endogenous inhibitor of DNA gyrase (YacG/DUF329 family)